MKKLFKNPIFNIFLIFLFSGLVLYFTFRKDGQEVLEVLSRLSIGAIIGLILLTMLERACLAFGLTISSKLTNPEYKFWQGFLNAYVAGLFCNITPGASGGQVAQGYIFHRQGIPLSKSVGILWLDFIVYQATMCTYVLVLLLLRFHYFYSNYSRFFFIVILGFLVGVAAVVIVVLIVKSEKFYNWLSTTGVDIGVRFHFVKDSEETRNRLNEQLKLFQKELAILEADKKLFFLLVLENLGRLTIYYSIPLFCAKALQIPVEAKQIINIICLTAFVTMVNAFLPMPGSTGGTEATFILMFSTIFTPVDSKSIMLVWRVVTFYLTLIIGSIMFLIAKAIPPVPIKESLEGE